MRGVQGCCDIEHRRENGRPYDEVGHDLQRRGMPGEEQEHQPEERHQWCHELHEHFFLGTLGHKEHCSAQERSAQGSDAQNGWVYQPVVHERLHFQRYRANHPIPGLVNRWADYIRKTAVLQVCSKCYIIYLMNPTQTVTDTKNKLAQATEHFKQELGKIRTGRAHPGMLDSVVVEVYGQQMPLKAVAGITAPEAQLLQITPFDPSNLQAISDAIRNNPSLDLNPADDGRVVRIQIPALTQETRQAMVKILNQKVEETLITARQLRHEALHIGNQAEKSKEISKDERLRFEKQIDELLTQQKAQLDGLSKAKEQEILTI